MPTARQLTAAEIEAGTPRARAQAKRRQQVLRARRDCAYFMEFAIPHEKTGESIRNAPHHVEWQRVLDENQYVVITASVEHGKTQQISVGRALWMIGNDPESRGAIICNTGDQAVKILGAIKQHIEDNPLVKEVFPGLKRGTRSTDKWLDNQIFVQRKTIAKDPTIQALGQGSKLLEGSRLDWAICDDLLDFETTRTIEQITKTIDWFDAKFFSRLMEYAPCWVIGTPWANLDLYQVLSERPMWHFASYPAVENPDDSPDDWRPIWFSKERLIKIFRNTTIHNFFRRYFCRVRMDDNARFRMEWIERCKANGKGWKLFDRAPRTPGGKRWPCFTGVDLGIGEEEHHDLSVLFTIAIEPRTARKVVCEIQAGRWQAPEIVNRIYSAHQRFDSLVIVESNGAQSFLLQWPGMSRVPVTPYNTGTEKHDPDFGVESIAVEMRNGQWVIPNSYNGDGTDPEVLAWIQEMLFYKPKTHTGDRLMACWFARELARDSMQGIMGQQDAQAR